MYPRTVAADGLAAGACLEKVNVARATDTADAATCAGQQHGRGLPPRRRRPAGDAQTPTTPETPVTPTTPSGTTDSGVNGAPTPAVGTGRAGGASSRRSPA